MGKVAVIHPDLGIGGAERLIVDASRALKECGHQVTIYTGYHDPTRCFEETRDGTLQTIVVGGWIPRTIFNRFHALLAYLKMIFIAIYLLLFHKHDLILCDQVSACIPILRLDFKNRPKIVFYCHFPDQLLTVRDTLLKSFYRKPLDWFEEWSTARAHTILVNSKFTSKVVKRTFKSLKDRNLIVLYPCVDVKIFTHFKLPKSFSNGEINRLKNRGLEGEYIFLSLNRFERKKNLGLAIEALGECISMLNTRNAGQLLKPHLVVAGGYDERLSDCVDYLGQLQQLVDQLGLSDKITFIKSPSDEEKLSLLNVARAILYTPENEHFGIVPLEAMASSKPIIACNSGGPLETIDMDINGFLCENNKHSFADAMIKLLLNEEIGIKMGEEGLKRVNIKFSYEAFKKQLDDICYRHNR